MKWFGAKPPAWASHLSKSQFSAFKADVEEAATLESVQGTYDWTEGTLTTTGGVLGFHNLVLYWANSDDPRNEARRFLGSIRAMGSQECLSWEEAQGRLYVQIGLPEAYPIDMPGVSESPVAPWYERIMVDLPNAVRLPLQEELDSWGKEFAELRKVALENVWRESVQIDRGELHGNAITALSAKHFWAGAHALLLERYVHQEAPFGHLVTIPSRHLAMFAPVSKTYLDDQLTSFAAVGQHHFNNSPGPISPGVFFWYAGKFYEFEFAVEKDRFRAVDNPTMAYVQALFLTDPS